MIDPVYKRLLAENAWLKQQIAQLQEEHESDIKHTPEDIARHNEIVDKVARHHGTLYPHYTDLLTHTGPDIEKSIADIKQNIGKRPAAPKFNRVFKSVDDALDDMKDDGGFVPYHLRAPNYFDHDESKYGEMLASVKNSIDKEEQDKKEKK